MNQRIPYYYALPAIFIATLLGANVIYSAWAEPSLDPPGGNIPAPLNTGTFGQSKSGGLILNTGGAGIGLIVDQGNVGIGTQTPVYKLDVVGALRLQPLSVEPLGADGAIYYDTGLRRFRCHERGSWVNCIK